MTVTNDEYSSLVLKQKEVLDKRKIESEAAAFLANEVSKKQEEDKARNGYYIHYSMEDPLMPYGVNIHTHGMDDTWNHLDFQLVVNLGISTTVGIFKSFAEKIKGGEKFKDGDIVLGIIKGGKVKLIEVDETGRRCLRIILPDQNGEIDIEKMQRECAIQYLVPDKKED